MTLSITEAESGAIDARGIPLVLIHLPLMLNTTDAESGTTYAEYH